MQHPGRALGLFTFAVLASAAAPASSNPAARVGDQHVCPMVTGLVPHVGGPVIGPGATTVLICGSVAATVGTLASCNGPPDTVIVGSRTVLIGGKSAARKGDSTAHGGTIVSGCGSVLIGG